MGSKLDNFKGKQNTAGFDKNPQNINKEGRPLDLKENYRKTLEDQDGTIWKKINWQGTPEQFDELRPLMGIPMKRRGNTYKIGFNLHKKEALLARMDEIAFTAKHSVSAGMLKFIWEAYSGKAQQHIDVTSNGASVSNYVIAPASVYMQMIKEDEEHDRKEREKEL